MKLFTKKPNQHNFFNRPSSEYLGELVYVTPWNDSFLDKDLQVSGDLKVYAGGYAPSISIMWSPREKERMPNTEGYYQPDANRIVCRRKMSLDYIVVHELQHALQKRMEEDKEDLPQTMRLLLDVLSQDELLKSCDCA